MSSLTRVFEIRWVKPSASTMVASGGKWWDSPVLRAMMASPSWRTLSCLFTVTRYSTATGSRAGTNVTSVEIRPQRKFKSFKLLFLSEKTLTYLALHSVRQGDWQIHKRLVGYGDMFAFRTNNLKKKLCRYRKTRRKRNSRTIKYGFSKRR